MESCLKTRPVKGLAPGGWGAEFPEPVFAGPGLEATMK